MVCVGPPLTSMLLTTCKTVLKEVSILCTVVLISRHHSEEKLESVQSSLIKGLKCEREPALVD